MKKLFLAFVIIFNQSASAQEVLDKIVAVIDNEIILQSELELQVNLFAAQRNLNPSDKELRKRVLDEMINNKLLYAQSLRDSITITYEEVEMQLDNQMNYFIQQYGSREIVEKTYGMSIERIKREFREDTRKQMAAERLKQMKFGSVDITRREVLEFYENYKDSLGLIPEKFELSHIFINPKATEKVKRKAREFAESLLDSLKNGADFARLAEKYSEDPGSSSQGGDLGVVKRGVFYPEFEAAAYSLKPGEISTVVESPVGYHIIELIDRKGESINSRHILIKIKNDEEADLKAIELLTEIRDSIERGVNTFAFFAGKYSDDVETARLGGKLGNFEIGQLDKSLLDQVIKLKVNEISFPKRLQVDKTVYGFHIIKLHKRTPEHIANIDQDYEDIKRLAQFQKREWLYKEWIADIRGQIYWKINI